MADIAQLLQEQPGTARRRGVLCGTVQVVSVKAICPRCSKGTARRPHSASRVGRNSVWLVNMAGMFLRWLTNVLLDLCGERIEWLHDGKEVHAEDEIGRAHV